MEELKFKRKASNNNGSITVIIPTELAAFADIEAGKEVTFIAQKKKFGKFIALYNEGAQNKEN